MKEVKAAPDINALSKGLSKRKEPGQDNADLKHVARIADGKQTYGELQRNKPRAVPEPTNSYLQQHL